MLTTLQEILSRLEDKPLKERMPERCVTYAHAHGVPQELLDILEECAYGEPIRIGPVWLSRLAELDIANEEDVNAACLSHGFLIVGSGLNGDPIAVELSSGLMAFISHDLLWEEDYDEFDECVVRTPLGFHDFWVQAWETPDFPRDSYDAATRWSARA